MARYGYQAKTSYSFFPPVFLVQWCQTTAASNSWNMTNQTLALSLVFAKSSFNFKGGIHHVFQLAIFFPRCSLEKLADIIIEIGFWYWWRPKGSWCSLREFGTDYCLKSSGLTSSSINGGIEKAAFVQLFQVCISSSSSSSSHLVYRPSSSSTHLAKTNFG